MLNDLQFDKINTIRKIIMITVIILLGVWLVFFIKLIQEDSNILESDTNYDKNVENIKNVAIKYFKENEDKNIISLKSMYQNKLIDTIKTSNNKECVDIASFAKLEKQEEKYKLEVILVCDNISKTTTSYYNDNRANLEEI